MPFDRPGQDGRLFRKLLCVVLAEVHMFGRLLMEGEDIVRGLQFGDGNETDLHVHHQRLGSLGVCVTDHCVDTWRVLAAPEIFCRTLPTFSASTWARWGSTRMFSLVAWFSSDIVCVNKGRKGSQDCRDGLTKCDEVRTGPRGNIDARH